VVSFKTDAGLLKQARQKMHPGGKYKESSARRTANRVRPSKQKAWPRIRDTSAEGVRLADSACSIHWKQRSHRAN
jgi:hypothetical protein